MSGADAPLLVANPGAEDGGAGGEEAARAAALCARLWRLLFVRAAREPGEWPEALGPEPEGAAFPWLESAPGSTGWAWLVDAEAEARAAARGVTLAGAPAEIVRRVHDKAFAWRAALEAGHAPPLLRGAVHVLEPGDLEDAEACASRLAAWIADWPEGLGPRATLKPRLGCSGRGRVALDAGPWPALAGALPRLRARGGALLEPWLPRVTDLSAQLHLEAGGELLLLGTLEQRVTPAGVPRGLRGTLDLRGRVTSGTGWDEELREAAVAVALAARDEGFRGPCGVDGFAFTGPDREPLLRPVVELNARFTLGTVALGLARRALPVVREGFDLDASERIAFELALDAPAAAPPAGVRRLALGEAGDGAGPALLLAPDAAGLDAALGA